LQFSTEAECRAWATKRKYPLGDKPSSVLADGPPFSCLDFAIPEDAGRRVALARFVWGAIGSQQATFLNDENRAPSTTIVDALRNYDIVPVICSQRDTIRQELAA
jgi:hypothetical protein